MTEFRRVRLRTGVTLNVALAGDRSNPPVILLHGFPESHRTWREVAPRLQDDFFLVIPDQRGFAASDQPQDVDSYKTDTLIDDIFGLADGLGIEEFALVGHDWGGAISWPAALRGDPRLTRLAIINAPVTIYLCIAYLIFSLIMTMAGRFPAFGEMFPHWLFSTFNPNDKTNLAPYRFLHFVAIVILSFFWITRRIFVIGRQAIVLDRVFAGLMCQGIGIWIGVQSFISIGVNLGALPTKGLTTPLLSFGGSALLMNLIALAIVVRVDFENRQLMRGGRA